MNWIGNTRFSVSGWDADGIAALEAWGSDARSALEEGLRAVLVLDLEGDREASETPRASPIHAEADTLQELFAALAAALLDQAEIYGSDIRDVSVDGVLRRGEGGYVAWGYVTGPLDQQGFREGPRLEAAAVEIGDDGVSVRARLRRIGS